MGTIGAVFQPEPIELMKAIDDATAMLLEAKRTSTMKAGIVSHSCMCREGRARRNSAENGRSLSRRGMYPLFS
jgi:hypothetical protein